MSEGIEILAHSPGEEEGVLRDGGKVGTKAREGDGGDVGTIDEDAAGGAVGEEAEECVEEAGFAAGGERVSRCTAVRLRERQALPASAAANADFLAGTDGYGDVLEDGVFGIAIL